MPRAADEEVEPPSLSAPLLPDGPARGSCRTDAASRPRTCLLALAMVSTLAAPIALPIGLYQLFTGVAADQECPFVPFDKQAQAELEKLFELSPTELSSALHCLGDDQQKCANISMAKSVALQLVYDANDSLFSENWIASAPIVLRNSFLSWLVLKVFFTAADIQDRGLLGVAVRGHGLRTSVVGESAMPLAGWVATVGDVDLSSGMGIWFKGLLWSLPGALVGFVLVVAVAGVNVVTQWQYLMWATLSTASLATLAAFYDALSSPDSLPTFSPKQPTWEEARLSLGLNSRQAMGLSVAKFFVWHNSQPTAYLLVLGRYFGCSEFMTPAQQVLGSIVAAREVMYMFSTAVAAFKCPVYLLFDVQTTWTEADTRFQGLYRTFAYLTMPHNFVSLCLANKSVELRLVFLPLALCQVIADFASCFALGPLLLASTQSPAAIKIGYAITSAAFLLVFGPLTVLSLWRRAKENPRDDRCASCSALASVVLALGLVYVITGFVLAAFEFDAICYWFRFMAPDCGERSLCGSEVPGVPDYFGSANRGECGPCTGNFITGAGWNGDPEPPCRLAPAYVLSGAWDSAYNGRYERLADQECMGVAVYQRGRDLRMYRYVDIEDNQRVKRWGVGQHYQTADCSRAYSYTADLALWSTPDCPDSPDGSGCVGKWGEHAVESKNWHHQDIKVTAG